jgi:hypothetical protein
MLDPETKVRGVLRELADEVRADPALERRTLWRARRRRIGTAAASALVVIAFVTGSAVALRTATKSQIVPAGQETPSPTPVDAQSFAGPWPETDADSLAVAQIAADEGHQPWRLDPAMTAESLAVDYFGYPPEDVTTDEVHVRGSSATVSVSNSLFGDPVPPITVELGQLGVTGPTGVWSVTSVTSPVITLDPVSISSNGDVTVSGRLADFLFDPAQVADAWAPKEIDITFVPGPTFDSAIGGSTVLPITRTFDTSVAVPPSDGRTLVLWVRFLDAKERALGAMAAALDGTTTPGSPAPSPEALPAPVATTRAAIVGASVGKDFDALGALIDPTRFSYNFSDGHDPIPEWRADPGILDTITKILGMPFATRHSGTGDVYVWPSFADADLTTLTAAERTLVGSIGVTRKDVETMIASGGYTGPRLGIASDGRWLFYADGPGG